MPFCYPTCAFAIARAAIGFIRNPEVILKAPGVVVDIAKEGYASVRGLFGRGGGEGSLKTTTLYRSVNHEELKQLRQAKQFAQGPNSLEGKFFAENYADAEKWGNALNGVGNHVVIEVEVPISAADKMMRWNRLDGIGPARYGTLDQLKNININIPSLSNDLFKP